MLYLFIWHQGDGVAIDEAALKGHCVNLLRSVWDTNLPVTAPTVFLSLFTFYFIFLVPWVKSWKAVRKLVKGFIIWRACCRSPLLLSTPSSKSQLLQWCVIEIFIVGNVALGGSRPGGSWGWRIATLAFYVCALLRQTRFIRESPRMLCDRNACLSERWLQ